MVDMLQAAVQAPGAVDLHQLLGEATRILREPDKPSPALYYRHCRDGEGADRNYAATTALHTVLPTANSDYK